MDVFDKGFITILGCTSLLILIAIPLVLRKVPRNIVYGFRTRATLSDDFVWYEANAYFGRGLLIAGLVTAAAILILYCARGVSPGFFLKVSIAALVVPPLLATLATLRFVRTLTSGGPARRGPHRP